jgi:hypothetical protein
MDSDKLEFLVNECSLYRQSSKNQEAYESYLKAMDIIKYKGKMILEYQDTIYRLLYEFSIFSFYIGKKDEGLRVSDKILFSFKLNNVKNQIANNQRYYMEPLGSVIKFKKQIKIKCEKDYVEMNPSIIRTEHGFLMNCRTVNFGVKPGGIYYSRSPDGIVNTKNYILELDNNFTIKSQIEVIDRSSIQRYPSSVVGLEDLIIFKYQNELWGTCTTIDTQPIFMPQISLCRLDYDGIADKYIISNKNPLKLIQDGRPEKNWLPFVLENSTTNGSHDATNGSQSSISFVYSYFPTVIRQVNSNLLESVNHIPTELYVSNFTTLDFSRFRGSGGPLLFPIDSINYYLIVVHEVSWCADKSRIYTHRFVLMTLEFKIVKISDPWYFERHGLEFCRSICDFNDLLVITCGLNDDEAWCYILEKSKIRELLKDVSEFML